MQLQTYTKRFIEECEMDNDLYPLASMERRIVQKFGAWLQKQGTVIIVPEGKGMECPVCGQKLAAPVIVDAS